MATLTYAQRQAVNREGERGLLAIAARRRNPQYIAELKRMFQVARSHETYIYVIAADGADAVKIGISSDVEQRLQTLQIGSPAGLSIYCVRYVGNSDWAHKIERKVHRVLRKERSHGEWFHIAPPLAAQALEQVLRHYGFESADDGSIWQPETRDIRAASSIHASQPAKGI